MKSKNIGFYPLTRNFIIDYFKQNIFEFGEKERIVSQDISQLIKEIEEVKVKANKLKTTELSDQNNLDTQNTNSSTDTMFNKMKKQFQEEAESAVKQVEAIKKLIDSKNTILEDF